MIRRHRRKILVAGLLGGGILATFLREIIFAWKFGDGPQIEAFRVAFALPLMLGQSLAPAVVGAALPALAFAAAHGQDAYLAMRRRVLLVGGALSALLAAGCLLAAPAIIRVTAPGFPEEQLLDATRTFRILCAYLLFFGLTFGPRGLLNLQDVLWPGAAVSLLVSAGLVCGALFGDTLDALAWSGAAAAAALLALHLHALRRLPADPGCAVESQESGEERPTLLLPVAGLLFYQVIAAVPRFLDRGVASSMTPGSVAALDYSYAVLAAPAILLGTSFVMIAFPPFSRAVARGTGRAAAARGARPLLVLLLSTAVVAVAVRFTAVPLVDVLLGRGAFDAAATEQTASVLYWHAAGFPLGVVSMVLAQALMAFRRVSWLIAAGAARVVVRLVAIETLVDGDDLAGLGQAYAVTEWVSGLLLATLLVLALRRST